ncbi:diguanylate cyclase (GGDEF) domain-containing protein [Jatrophihabitans endophyticus]|uniref:Diguanylate cyclase (GGDEF) domain-containing protein n=1 Tax=Jatrophihabitans endophyticus TaxID=1206085 RepID=A0A1M5K3A4_9ACTN|nr:diguanylate cyclase (GGDEF) domain-containing protein [Jatrophihabitans endophyticus]
MPVDPTPAGPAARGTAVPHHGRLFVTRLSSLADATGDPAAVGRLLLVAAGLAVAVGAPLLRPSSHTWLVLAVVSVVMAATLVVSARIDWTRLPRQATLVHPAMVALALTVLGLAAPTVFGPLVGVLVLCFAYIGLTQRPGTSVFALLPASGAYLVVYDELTAAVLVRLAIALLIWLLLAELLAHMSARQAALTRALRAAAHSDALTGVANRRDWQARIAAAAPGDALVLCDIDHFKAINDTHGHAVGDQVLADFGELLLGALREGDYCARYGGEEFALLLPHTSIENVTAVLARLHRRWQRIRPDVTFSAGVAVCRAGRTHDETFDAADEALYAAKRGGRDTDRIEPAPGPAAASPVGQRLHA